MVDYTNRLNTLVPGTGFTWKNMLYSNAAKAAGLLNYQYNITEEVEANIIALAQNVLEPIRTGFTGTIRINSVYRSPQVNALIPGAQTSQHLKGQAADIIVDSGGKNSDLYNYIVNTLAYDQIIWEKGTPPPNGQPAWVHASYSSLNNRKQQLVFDGKNFTPNTANASSAGANEEAKIDGIATAGDVPSFQGDGKVTDAQGNVPNFSETFRQIETNINNIEKGDVDVTWGKQSASNEDSDWIGLKQFILYLATRYTPQSLYPFVELIPTIQVERASNPAVGLKEATDKGYVRDGKIPKDVQDNLSKGSASDLKFLNQLKFLTELPAGFNQEKFNTGADASNAAAGSADMFTLDPFKEGHDSLNVLSASGEAVKKIRNVGMRIYGQMVLSPGAIDGVPSKPGAIGFQSLEVKAGSQSDNGLALISMELVDIQGNKFTDLNSPWAFLFDVRTGSLGGDFWFRYGWQVRLPDPNDKLNASSAGFWSHPGWLLFGNARDIIAQQILPGRNTVTLTQSINTGPSMDSKSSSAKELFDEGIIFDEATGQVKVGRKAAMENNYVKLSILNPELKMDDNGALIASLSFRTTGALAMSIPLEYAINMRTKAFFTKEGQATNKILLTDLLLLVMLDSQLASFISITSDEERAAKRAAVEQNINGIRSSRNVDNLVYIVGLDEGGDDGSIHPDSIIITVPDKYLRQLTNPKKENTNTIIKWFRQVLQSNDCELQSVATGSGAGINAAWIITTTQKLEKKDIKRKSSAGTGEGNDPRDTNSTFSDTWDRMSNEKDVFSYRFQGSLVEKLSVEKTDAPNAMKIQTDFTVADLQTYDATSTNTAAALTSKTTAADRKNNMINLFSQLQNCTINCLAHPWLGPGRRVFVKGMGFYDGEYIIMEITHKIGNDKKFTSEIIGSRILVQEKDDKNDAKANAQQNGKSNLSTPALAARK